MPPWASASAIALWAVTATVSAGAQDSSSTRLIDRLRLDGLGVAGGVALPLAIKPTTAYAVEADYGELAPHWRIFLGAGVWSSRYTDAAVMKLINTVYSNSVTRPNAADTLRYRQISITDIILSADARYSPLHAGSFLRPYVSGGMALHVQNATGAAVRGTIVEKVIDGIAPGFAASTGLEMRLAGWLVLDGQARYDLVGGDRFATFRAGVRYLFSSERHR